MVEKAICDVKETKQKRTVQFNLEHPVDAVEALKHGLSIVTLLTFKAKIRKASTEWTLAFIEVSGISALAEKFEMYERNLHKHILVYGFGQMIVLDTFQLIFGNKTLVSSLINNGRKYIEQLFFSAFQSRSHYFRSFIFKLFVNMFLLNEHSAKEIFLNSLESLQKARGRPLALRMGQHPKNLSIFFIDVIC